MLEQTIGAKVDWQEPAWPAPEKTWQKLWEFKASETEPVTFGTAINDLEMHLESIKGTVQLWTSKWNIPSNTSGTISAAPVISDEPDIVYVSRRNACSRPWLDELSEIRPPTLKVVGRPSERGFAIIAEPVTREIERPAASLRQKEVEWLSSNTEKLSTYEGNWIALEGDKIVAWGSDEVVVEMQARTKGVKVPLLFRIPSKEDKPFIGHNPHDSDSIR